jgi:hypothetical protein
MSNLLLCFPIYSDDGVLYTPTYSGGSWQPSLPLTNLKDRRLVKVARSTNALLTSTIVKCDLGVARPIRAVVIPKHTMSSAALARVRLFATNPIFEDNDFNAWTSSGTPVITTGQADPLGGTRATLVGDDDGAANEGKSRLCGFTGDGVKTIALTICQSTATVSEFGVHDATAGAWRHGVRATWSGGVPTLSTVLGSGTLYTPIDLGGGLWEVQFTVAGVVAANANRMYVYGAAVTSATTGNTRYYEAMAFDYATQPILHDSAAVAAWPAGVTAEDVDGINVAFQNLLAADVTARYVRVEIADTANSAGYIDLARLLVTGGYQPTVNMLYGANLGLVSTTERNISDGAAAIYDVRPSARSLRFSLEIDQSEAFANAWQILQRLGKHGQLFAVFDPSDAVTLLYKRSFLGVLRELSALDFPHYNTNAIPFDLIEDL